MYVSVCFYCLRFIAVFCSSDWAACWLCWNCMYDVWCWYWTLSWCLWLPYEICFAWNDCKGNTKCCPVRILLLHYCCWEQIKISIFDHRLYQNYTFIIFHTPDSIFMQDVELAFSPAIYKLSTKNTFCERQESATFQIKGSKSISSCFLGINCFGMETDHL